MDTRLQGEDSPASRIRPCGEAAAWDTGVHGGGVYLQTHV